MLVSSLAMKSRKRPGHEIMYTSAIHASIVHGITDLVKMAVLIVTSLRLLNVDFNNNGDFSS